jgi:hypothetical protein
MQRIACAGSLCLAIAGCGTSRDPVAGQVPIQANTECSERVATTGTHITKGVQCVALSDQAREETRRQTDAISSDQQRMQLPRPGTGGR